MLPASAARVGKAPSKIGEPLTNRPIGQRNHHRGIKLADDDHRSGLGYKDCMPDRRVESGQPCLVNRWDIGCRCKPTLGCNRIRLNGAGTHLWQRIGCQVDHHIDLSSQQILHCQVDAAIRHELKTGARFFLEIGARDMRWAACAASALRCLVRICLQPSDQLRQVLRRHGFLCNNELRLGCN